MSFYVKSHTFKVTTLYCILIWEKKWKKKKENDTILKCNDAFPLRN